MIYFDNAASTVIHKDVLDAMTMFFTEQYGNPSSIHKFGRQAYNAISNARKQVASLIGASPSEIFFTSGGTESNNAALNGMPIRCGEQIIASAIEHDAILEPCKKLASNGVTVSLIPVDKFGLVNPADLKCRLSEKTRLVSIMFANNEVGTIQPIADIARICHEKNIPFHTDAIQAVGKIPINVHDLGIDMLSISSHKIHGPKGVGALYIRDGISLEPSILGGGQENGMRSGTENVANIAGFGMACQIAKNNLNENYFILKKLRDDLITQILQEIKHVAINGHRQFRLPNNAHLTFLGVNGEDLIIKLDEHGIAASTGSACSVNTQKASHVLQAMGFSLEQITGSLRLTVGIYNTADEVRQTVNTLKIIIKELRAVSPFKEKYSFT